MRNLKYVLHTFQHGGKFHKRKLCPTCTSTFYICVLYRGALHINIFTLMPALKFPLPNLIYVLKHHNHAAIIINDK